MWFIVLTLLVWLTGGARGAPLVTADEDPAFMAEVRYLLPVLTKNQCSCPLAHGQHANRSNIMILTTGSESLSPRCWYGLKAYTCTTKHRVTQCTCSHHDWTLPVGKLGQGETEHRRLGVRNGVRFSYESTQRCNGDQGSCYHDTWLVGYRVQDGAQVSHGGLGAHTIQSEFDVTHWTTRQELQDHRTLFRRDPDALYPVEQEKPVVHDAL